MFYLLLALCISLVVWRWFKKQDPSDPPVMPGKLPLLGHGLMLLGDSVDMYNAIKRISGICRDMGGVFKLYLGPRLFYIVVDPEDSLTVSSECMQKHFVYDFAKPLIGNGILNADVATWKKHRRLLNPAFSQIVLDGFIETFNTQAQSLVDQFAGEVGKPFDHEAYLRINNLNTIFATSFGAKPEECQEILKEYLPQLEEFLHICTIRVQNCWFHDDFLFSLSSWNKRQQDLAKNLNDISKWVIQKKVSNIDNEKSSENKSGKLQPFIDLIMEAAKDNPSLNDWQIRSETSTMIVGGHETSATSLTYALTVLGSHPEAQEKAYQEILQVLGDTKKCINKEDLSKLVYIDAIVKEILRLYPIIPIVARQLDKDIKLKNYTLKAGNACVVSLYGIQRDQSLWGPDADEFRPERWFEPDSLPDPKYQSWFGLGRRICIGKTYGMMSVKIVLAHVLRSYVVSSDVSKMVLKMDIFTKPVEGYHIALEHRQ